MSNIKQGISNVQGKKYDLGDRLVDCAVQIVEPPRREKSDSDPNLGYWTLGVGYRIFQVHAATS